MALTKVNRGGLSTGVSDSSDATAITIDSSERTTFSSNVSVGSSSFPSKFTVSHAGTDNIIETANTTNSVRGGMQADTSIVGMGSITSHTLVLRSNNTERMRFDTGGHVMINSTAVSGAAKLTLKFPDASEEGIVCLGTDNASGSGFVVFRKADGTTIGQIKKNGTSDAVQYVTSSDYRLKENVSYSFDATTRVKQLKPARFNFISDPNNTVVDGFLAHEVSSIVPEAIDGDKDATQDISDVVLHADGKVIEENVTEAQWTVGKSDGTYAANTTWVASKTVPKYQGIDQSKLVPLLVKTIQELEARITALEDA